jgi:hypothetical protein
MELSFLLINTVFVCHVLSHAYDTDIYDEELCCITNTVTWDNLTPISHVYGIFGISLQYDDQNCVGYKNLY